VTSGADVLSYSEKNHFHVHSSFRVSGVEASKAASPELNTSRGPDRNKLTRSDFCATPQLEDSSL
jgi:hypothetical protein